MITKQHLNKLSTRPGVYLYYDKRGTVIYVGKARNLRNRVRQYFARDDALGPKTTLLVSHIASIKTIPTDTEFDALLLEAELIRRYLPKYNAAARDDKSPLYIAVTFDEPLPRILLTRKTTIDVWAPMPKRRFIAGPFQSGRVARRLMQSVRRAVPYCTQKRRDGRPCFYTHIGLCYPCPSAIAKMPRGDERKRLASIYRNNLRRIALLLSGHGRRVRLQLESAMREAAKRMAFEEAGEYKRQLDALDLLLTRSFDPSIYTDRTSEPRKVYEERLDALTLVLEDHSIRISRLHRIECFDVSTIQGKWATASLVVFTDGIPDTDEYRRFRIRASGRANDVGMMAEAMRRRLNHPEWLLPDLLIVDGGRPQTGAAKQALRQSSGQAIPVIGLAKRFEEIVIPMERSFKVLRLPPASPALQLLQHIRDEAHRFAKRYHIHLRSST